MKNWKPICETAFPDYVPFDTLSAIIFGLNGVGKTAFIAQLILSCMNDRTHWDAAMRECYRHVAEYNDGGYRLTIPPHVRHLVYTNIEGGIADGEYTTHDIDVSRFGLKCVENPEPFLLPYGGVVVVDEAQRVLNARKGGIPDHVSVLSEIKRHNGLTFIMACQRIMLIDKNYRELFHKFIEIIGMKHKYDSLGRLVQTTWICYEFENSFLIESYLESGKKHAGFGKLTHYTYHGDIFETYDSEACEAAFLDGAENSDYEFTPAPAKERTVSAASGFVKRRFNHMSVKQTNKEQED